MAEKNIGGDQIGQDKVGNDKFDSDLDGATNAVVGKNNHQTVNDTQYAGNRTDVNISLQNQNSLEQLRSQLSRMEEQNKFEFRMLDRDMQTLRRDTDNLIKDVTQMRSDVILVRLTPPVSREQKPLTVPVIWVVVALLIVLFFVSLYWIIRLAYAVH